jgi:hypothetical protein
VNDLKNLLEFLIKSPLDFVIVGGFAAVLHGCNQSTRDIDICLALSPDQIQILRHVLASIHPKLRTKVGKPSFLTLPEDITEIKTLHLDTDLGVLDIISQVEGVGDFYDVLRRADEIELYGGTCFLIAIDDLIKCKKALGRHRDLAVVEELEEIKKLTP